MLSGDIGCGKTTLTKVCIQELSADRYDISLIVNPKLEPWSFCRRLSINWESLMFLTPK